MTNASKLNTEQQQALEALHKGSVAVLAGPGSGKTHSLAAAVQSIAKAQPVATVLCLTFTTKAADNVRSRIGEQKGLFIGTFHALALKLLATDDDELRIATNEAVMAIVANLKNQQSKVGNMRELALTISRYKNGSIDTPEARQLVEAYDAELAKQELLDYDDLILRCLQLASGIKAYDYIFVDEFQDTSPRQYELLQELSGTQTKLFVIGDPKQSIYRFRGADGSVFERLEADFSPQVVHLQSNYRSAAAIVQAANRIFPELDQQQTQRQADGQLRIIETLDEYSEPDYIQRVVQQALGGTEWQHTYHDQAEIEASTFQDFAVLYRTRRQGELLARKLRSAGLPVQSLGEDSPYATPVVQLVRIIGAHVLTPDVVPYAKVQTSAALTKMKINASTIAQINPGRPPTEFIQAVAQALALPDDASLLQFENLASQFSDLQSLLDYVNELSSQAFFDPRAEAVCLSTIHASKGLEFRHVFVAGCNQGLLPGARATDPDSLAEERRLFYVAITRAQDSLTLLHSRRYGKREAQASSFLQLLDVPEEVDGGLAAIEQQRRRSRQKRAQQRLF